MPIPPHLARALSFTSSGVPYQSTWDDYAEAGAANAREIDINVMIGEEDTEYFLQDILGYTTWDGVSPSLQRVLPLQTPDGSGLWCDSYQLVKKGLVGHNNLVGIFAYGAKNLADAFTQNWPTWDWSMYRLKFLRPAWWVRSNITLASLYGNLEQFRYTQTTPRFSPRMRKKPGYQFQYTDPVTALVTKADEVGFSPDFQIEFVVIWKQVPVNAIPWTAIQNAMNTVNLNYFSVGISPLGAVTFPVYAPAFLCFRGPSSPISLYQGADGNLYSDLAYTFSFQPGGWNSYRLNSQTFDVPPQYQYAPVYACPPAPPLTPPFPSTDFQLLFTPASS
jgi:hypothetical protein